MTNLQNPKADAIKRLQSDMLRRASVFGKTASDMVYGEGDITSRIMLVGEAPGAEETRLSRPFVGRAGENLDGFLFALGMPRSSIYITNAIKFRPYREGSSGRRSNRPPSPDEIACMLPCLLREIEIIAPNIVVTLGNVALKCLVGSKAVIGGCHALPCSAKALSHRFTLFPLYHPASVIYNRALKQVYSEDLKKLKAFISSL